MSEQIQDKIAHLEEDRSIKFYRVDISRDNADCNADTLRKQEKPMLHKTEIEIEISESIVYSRKNGRSKTLCSKCRSPVQMSTPQIAEILNCSADSDLYRLIESVMQEKESE